MKKIILLLIIALAMSGNVSAETLSNYWKVSGSGANRILSPLKSTWGVDVSGGITFGGSMSSSLNMNDNDILNVGTLYVDADSNSGVGSSADNTLDFFMNGINYYKISANNFSYQGSSPTLTTTSNVSLNILPNGTGNVVIGDATIDTTGMLAGNDNLQVTGDLIMGNNILTGGMSYTVNRGDVPYNTMTVNSSCTEGTAQSLMTIANGEFISGPYFECGASGAVKNKGFRAVALQVYGRVQERQGTDIASATNIVLPSDGNVFEITGTTKIDLISSLGWQEGSIVRLVCNESVVLDNGTASSGTNITILLAGASDFSCTAEDVITLALTSTTATGQAWREVSRSAN